MATSSAGSQGGRTHGDGAAGAGRVWQEWMMVAVGLTALLSILAIIVAVAALATGGNKTVTQTTPAATAGGAGAAGGGSSSAKPASTASAPAKTEAITLTVKTDTEHGKLGPDGQYHDAFLPADFSVHAGDRVVVTAYNYDSSPHSFTSFTLTPGNPLNQVIAAGSEKTPGKTTFTFTAPSRPGKYLWWCAMTCDPWAMSHIGFMRGYVTVAA